MTELKPKRSFSRFLGLDVDYFFKNTSMLTLSQLVEAGANFVLVLTMANIASKDFFGKYRLVLSMIGLFEIFALPGMATAIVIGVGKKNIGVYYDAILSSIKWSLLGSIGILTIAFFLFHFENSELHTIFFCMAFVFPFYAPSVLFRSYLVGKRQFGRMAFLQVTMTLIRVFVTILTLVVFNDLLFVILSSFASDTCLRGLLTLKFLMKTRNTISNAETIRFGKHMTLLEVPSLLLLYIDQILVSLFLGFEELAAYAITTYIPELIKSLSKVIGPLTLPKLVVMDNHTLKRVFWNKMMQIFLFSAFVSLFYILVSPTLFQFFFPTYQKHVLLSQVFMLSFLVLPNILITTMFNSRGLTKEIYRFRTSAFIVQLVFLLLLIPSFGLVGAILARCFSRIVFAVILCFQARSVLKNLD